MLKLIASLAVTISQSMAANPLNAVLDDLQKSYSGGYSYSSSNKCDTTKSCVEYVTLRSRQLVEKYEEKKETDPDYAEKISIATKIPQLVKHLLETASVYPQAKIFQSMSSQGQTKYRQGIRVRIPDLNKGFDILAIDQTRLSEADKSTLSQLTKEVQAIMMEENTSSYHISNIQGISLSYDDILSAVLDKIDTLDTTSMNRDSQTRAFVGIIDDVLAELSADDNNAQKLANLRSTLESEGEKSPLSFDTLIQFLQMNFGDPSARPENDQEKYWKSQKSSFQSARSPSMPVFSNLGNLSFDVTIGSKTHHLTAKNVGSRLKEKERVYAQLYIYKDMSAAAQAEYRSGVRYTISQSVLARDLFAPLNDDATDAQIRSALESLKTEFREKVKSIMVGQKIALPAIQSIAGAQFDYDQLLNIILAKMNAVSNRPADRQGNLAIDLKIIDSVIEKLDKNDKATPKLLALRQKIETGQSSTYYNSYNYQTTTTDENKSEKEWKQIKSQLQPAQSEKAAKIININEIRLYFTIIGHKQSVSLQDAGTSNYLQRRLSGSNTKYKKEKRAVLDDLVTKLSGITCRSREDCKRQYLEEITATKVKFGGRASSYVNPYNTYSSGYNQNQGSRANTQKSQEMDSAIQGMLDDYSKVITQAFDMDRPHTALVLYTHLSADGQQNYLNGVVIGAPNTAKIFTSKDKAKAKKTKVDIWSSISGLFGGGQPAQPTATPEKKIDYAALETKLKPYAFYDTDDMIIYTMQSIENQTCRSFSECGNSETRAIETVMRSLNPNDPTVPFLQSVIDAIKAKERTNPLDIRTITDAFITAGFSPRIKLTAQDETQWNQILDQRSGKRQRATPPRIANKDRIQTYVEKKTNGTGQTAADPMAAMQQALAGALGTTTAPVVAPAAKSATPAPVTTRPYSYKVPSSKYDQPVPAG